MVADVNILHPQPACPSPGNSGRGNASDSLTVKQLEGGEPSRFLRHLTVVELEVEKVPHPVLMGHVEGIEEMFQCAIESFTEPVGLGMVGGAKQQFYSAQLPELFGQIDYELDPLDG